MPRKKVKNVRGQKRCSINIGLYPHEVDQLQAVAADLGLSQYAVIKRAIMAFNPNRVTNMEAKLASLESKLDKLLGEKA